MIIYPGLGQIRYPADRICFRILWLAGRTLIESRGKVILSGEAARELACVSAATATDFHAFSVLADDGCGKRLLNCI